jgi:hypothetical protein
MNTRNGILVAALAACFVVGCGKKDDAPAGDAPAKSGAPAAKPAQGSPPPAAAAKPALEDTANKAMGYSIKLPKGSKTSMNDANGGSYGFDTMIILVGPTGTETKVPDDLLRAVNTTGGTIEKKTVGNSLVAIVTKPSSPVAVYAGPKGKKIMATCMAEPSAKDLAVEICASLTSTK